MNKIPKIIQDLANETGGKVNECQELSAGSGFAIMSFPLPKNHWLTQDGFNVPPMPFRIGGDDAPVLGKDRNAWAEAAKAAARYAIRASTLNGKENDFDPDAMVQNFVVGLIGYWTPNGLSSDPDFNPKPDNAP